MADRPELIASARDLPYQHRPNKTGPQQEQPLDLPRSLAWDVASLHGTRPLVTPFFGSAFYG